MSEMTTVRVSRNTRKRLAEIGTKEESFDDIIRRLINFYKRNSREK